MDFDLKFFDELMILGFFISSTFWMGYSFYLCFVSQKNIALLKDEFKIMYLKNFHPDAMAGMRWSSLVSFFCSLYLMSLLSDIPLGYNIGTSLAALIITLMFLNTWIIIWRKQKKIIAGTPDSEKCEDKYDLALKTNVIFSFPLIGLMVYSAQIKEISFPLISLEGEIGPGWSSLALWTSLLIILLLELNLIFGKNRKWMNKPKHLVLFGIFLITLIGFLLRTS